MFKSAAQLLYGHVSCQDDDEGGLSNGFLVQLVFTAGGLMGQEELDTLAAEIHTSDAVPDTIADHLTPSHYRLRWVDRKLG